MSPHLLFCKTWHHLLRKFEVRWLSKCPRGKLDEILREPCSYYGSASIPKWPQKQYQSIKFPEGACPQTPLLLHAYGRIHTYRSGIYVTPLVNILATSLLYMAEVLYMTVVVITGRGTKRVCKHTPPRGVWGHGPPGIF